METSEWLKNLILFAYLVDFAENQPSKILELCPKTLYELEKEREEYILSLRKREQSILRKGCFF